MSNERDIALIEDLKKLPAETSWVEFKRNNKDPGMIGRLASALSNAARLADQPYGFLLWGVEDGSHRIVGTDFDPGYEAAQKQPLEFWLAQRLKPSTAFGFRSIQHPSGRVVLLELPAASPSPIEFDGTAYIRIGSATPPLSDHPARLHALWDKLRPFMWEAGIATQFISADEVIAKLD